MKSAHVAPNCFTDISTSLEMKIRLESLELHSEVAYELSLPNDLHTASDLVTAVIYVLEGCCDHVHVVNWI